MKTLISDVFCLGLGYVANHLKNRLKLSGVSVTGSRRTPGKGHLIFDGKSISSELCQALQHCQNLLISTPPHEDGTDGCQPLKESLLKSNAQWIGYLSATNIYGDADGGWVDEMTDPCPTTQLGKNRLYAEQAWLSLFHEYGLPVHVFRLSGIYGPGRNVLDRIRNSTARNIIKENIVFSRIHVDDIVEVLINSMLSPEPGSTYNVSDDLPASPQQVLEYAAELLRLPRPEPISFENATLTPTALQFYQASKRVSNAKIKHTLIKKLIHPTFKEGLNSILSIEGLQNP